jgi:ketose-bisphosphate aldolase
LKRGKIMSLVKVNELLQHATENKYGVAAVNTLNIETAKYIIEAAERERVPIIVQFYPGFEKYTALSHMAFAACDMARKATVPVAVHLDHSAGFDIAVRGIRDGFPSVMIDGSALPYEENVEVTSAVVRTANVFGIDVEAELGHVGVGSNEDDIINTDHYTNVNQAVDFVQRTGCGSLAIAVGNAHGPYIRKPNLDFDRIKEIRSKVTIPLVLHGCSDIPEDQMREAVNLGMSKFNIATEYFRAMYRAIEKDVLEKKFDGDGVGLMFDIKEAMIDFVISKIRLLNPNKFSI